MPARCLASSLVKRNDVGRARLNKAAESVNAVCVAKDMLYFRKTIKEHEAFCVFNEDKISLF